MTINGAEIYQFFQGVYDLTRKGIQKQYFHFRDCTVPEEHLIKTFIKAANMMPAWELEAELVKIIENKTNKK